ncbi:CBS domain-containing protein [Streptomyces hygroscopicus]|uniref:CBS domain-containing protein n=1 Tax=Streptomyces hygroscopicus TaxID=1912 RepID=UPI00223F4437|nr:CBS domain-containing protein [Streptomyces hygroscopicus]MCW7943776.1 CBS domain-containing protein [Streptomyces hygroscopicus]
MHSTQHLVGDVMTGRVVALRRDATFKDIVKAVRQWKVSALPVVEQGNRVVGVVSEADLLRKEELRDVDVHADRRTRLERMSELAKADAVTAEELMTAPAVTVRVDATLAQAARIMAIAKVKRLPVVGDEDVLLGIVSRSDLLKVFERDDEDIAEEIRREIVDRLFPAPLEPVQVEVQDGVVKLSGRIRDTTLVPVATRLVRGVEGVVDVDCALMGPPRRPELDPDLAETTRRPWGAGTIT